jgi:hypothetical protein
MLSQLVGKAVQVGTKAASRTLRRRHGGREAGNREFVGRAHEVGLLRDQLTQFSAVYIHGVAGIGKSALLNRVLDRFQVDGTLAVRLDCRSVEPTEAGLLEGLGHALGWPGVPGLDEAMLRLGEIHGRTLIALDHYEVFRLMDTWLRQRLLPALPDSVRVIIASREPPVAAWFGADLAGRVRQLALGPLEEADAMVLLQSRGIEERIAKRLNRIARGHPLALTLAAEAAAAGPDPSLEEIAATRVLTELTHLFFDDIDDPLTRQALEAASVLRRATIPLLGAILPDAPAEEGFERLGALPFVEMARDGLVIHEAVREAIAARLRAVDPARHRRYRRAAWRALRMDVPQATSSELWRYTADMLYLFSNPVVREAFFPSGAQPLAVEPAEPGDEGAIVLIAERHEPPEAARLLAEWWKTAPQTFSVIRDRDGSVRAFFCLLDHSVLRSRLVKEDPIVESWRKHLRDEPIPRDQLALGLRRWLDIDHGEMPCASQAACWLDVKRTYMALRPSLRRIYVVVQDAATYWPVVEGLAFRQLSATTVEAAPGASGAQYASVLLDFGPGSVDGWLANLAAAELGIDSEAGLDEEARELGLDGRTIALTPLEFGLLRYLDARSGRAVSRPELLREVWATDFQGGSNVVDAVVRSLRRKLEPHGDFIEAVRGVGYRVRPDWRSLLL